MEDQVKANLKNVDLLIIDDAQSLSELNTLLCLSLDPKQVVFVGDPKLPRQHCFSQNSTITNFN